MPLLDHCDVGPMSVYPKADLAALCARDDAVRAALVAELQALAEHRAFRMRLVLTFPEKPDVVIWCAPQG
jgi:hypothetical protein